MCVNILQIFLLKGLEVFRHDLYYSYITHTWHRQLYMRTSQHVHTTQVDHKKKTNIIIAKAAQLTATDISAKYLHVKKGELLSMHVSLIG